MLSHYFFLSLCGDSFFCVLDSAETVLKIFNDSPQLLMNTIDKRVLVQYVLFSEIIKCEK